MFSINKEKQSISANTFETTMRNKGYAITDATSQFAEYDYVEQVYIAGNNEVDYQIEFYELSDDSYAQSFYANNQSKFETSKGNTATQKNASAKNYSKYELTANGKYQVVSRIDNTVIYVDVDNTYKDKVQDILKELGY